MSQRRGAGDEWPQRRGASSTPAALGPAVLPLGGLGSLGAMSVGRALLGGDPLIGALGAKLSVGSQLRCPLALVGGLSATVSILSELFVAQRLSSQSTDHGLGSVECQSGTRCAPPLARSRGVDRDRASLNELPTAILGIVVVPLVLLGVDAAAFASARRALARAGLSPCLRKALLLGLALAWSVATVGSSLPSLATISTGAAARLLFASTAIALGGLLTLLRFELVAQTVAFGLGFDLRLLNLGLSLPSFGLVSPRACFLLGLRSRPLKAALAGELLVVQGRARGLFGPADELAHHPAAGSFRISGIRHLMPFSGRSAWGPGPPLGPGPLADRSAVRIPGQLLSRL